MEDNKVAFIHSAELLKECNRLPTVLNRASIVYDLIYCYELFNNKKLTVIHSIPATEDELKTFHSSAYIEFVKKNNSSEVSEYDDDNESEEYGLCYDCPLLPKLFDLIQHLAGGSLTAAKLLNDSKYKIAINWYGGWHHAQRDEAEGFCYVNDIVLAIQQLTQKFDKILYVDLDIHHGNGVQNAFELSKKILTLSFHKYSPGFYPGSGGVDDVGCFTGKYYSLNVPLLNGCSSKTFLRCFTTVFPRVFQVFMPSAIVVQCGADCINNDPIGQINIIPKTMGLCVKTILNCGLPTLFLGGGGYNFSNTARYWTYLTSVILEETLDNDIPDCCQYFTQYGPTYELEIDEGNQKDSNTKEYIDEILTKILNYCNFIENN